MSIMLRISACFPIDLVTGDRVSVLGNRNYWPVWKVLLGLHALC